ncbi:MAG: hypothetical protein BJ554DRAFT_2727 [Olpidium bornovanus]|uniref:Uncharacterized protein n=1 Tax=Olpidium bornovanus TaxID=278681 RepID=A0A8H7ZQ18_9FUNG|nr:MAG: hypothetical protein BJ554DRAFT_2727 [Olpidium bornovanus]
MSKADATETTFVFTADMQEKVTPAVQGTRGNREGGAEKRRRFPNEHGNGDWAKTERNEIPGEIASTWRCSKQRDDFFDRPLFEKDGLLVIDNFFSAETADVLKKEAQDLLRNFDIAGHPMTCFVASEDENAKLNYMDDYFLSSGDKADAMGCQQIRFFFEEDAFDAQGNLTRPKELAVNKIGHASVRIPPPRLSPSPVYSEALHVHNPKFREFSTSEAVKGTARGLGFHDARILQSMVITKQPGIGGKGASSLAVDVIFALTVALILTSDINYLVDSHQDSTFLYTDPVSAVGFWFALEVQEALIRCRQRRTIRFTFRPKSAKSVREHGAYSWQRAPQELEEHQRQKPVRVHLPRESARHQPYSVTHVIRRLSVLYNLPLVKPLQIIEGEAKYDDKNW